MERRFRQEQTVLQQLDEAFPELGIYHQGSQSLLEQLGQPSFKVALKVALSTFDLKHPIWNDPNGSVLFEGFEITNSCRFSASMFLKKEHIWRISNKDVHLVRRHWQTTRST